MLLSEDAIAADYHETYPQVALVVDHLLDLEKSYGEAPQFVFATQVSRMLAMEGRGGVAKLTFGMFDPFRGDAEGLADVKRDWAEGVAGFKFYPPTGVRPDENDIPPKDLKGTVLSQWNSRYQGITSKTLDDRCKAFFSFCEANDVPILVHCSPGGFESVPTYGDLMANPKYWESVLARHPNLRVCLAHTGGSEGWYADFGNDQNESSVFRTEVLALCAAHPNVYCDFAYIEDLLKKDGVATMQARLRAILGANPGLSKKMLYGTDWHMLTQERGYESYLKLWQEVWIDAALSPYQSDFFAGNAARYLRLTALAVDPRLAPTVRAQLVALNGRLALEKTAPAMP
jgi:predicted TIM-barrel fold metal-dependent hydrolase